jgi:hypothetical protein
MKFQSLLSVALGTIVIGCSLPALAQTPIPPDVIAPMPEYYPNKGVTTPYNLVPPTSVNPSIQPESDPNKSTKSKLDRHRPHRHQPIKQEAPEMTHLPGHNTINNFRSPR